jgi:putative sterol carrier protein
MVRFLTTEWLAALDRAARADASLATATADLALVVEQEVTGLPAGSFTYHITFDHGSVSVAEGPAPVADVRFTQDVATARAIAAGTGSAQRAFMTGDLRVGGDLRVLLDHQVALSTLDDVFADVRARTEVDAPAGPAAGDRG